MLSLDLQDFPELGVIRNLLAQKYGKEFVAEAADDSICRKWQVNENLRRYETLLLKNLLSARCYLIVWLYVVCQGLVVLLSIDRRLPQRLASYC